MPSSSTKNNGNDDCTNIRESMQSNVFVKTPAHEFFVFNVKRPDLYPKAFPAVYKSVRVLQGKAGREGFVFESEFVGSIAQWTIEYVRKKPDDLDPIELYTTIVNSAALADDYIQKNKNP
ncbi:hypothetical protein ACFE04_031325 [Oxalis oulophora]